MKIVVIGPGAMGCLFAAVFAEAGHEVWMLDRRADRADLISREGIQLDTPQGTRRIQVRATVTPGLIRSANLVCVCVKAYHTHSVCDSLHDIVGPQTTILSIQNGLGNADILACAAPHSQVLAGVTTQGATQLGPGHIRHAGMGLTTIGPLDPRHMTRAIAVANMMNRCGIETIAVQDMAAALWNKLVINAAICPVSAISGLTNGQILDHPEWRALMVQAATEAASVAAAKQILLLHPDPVNSVLDVCRKTADNISSMLQDVQRGKPTEIDAINGMIVREADALDVNVPVNRTLIAQVRALTTRP